MLTIGHLQDLFYRCKYSALLAELEHEEAQGGALDAEMALIKANTLFEMHRVNDAKAVLAAISPVTADGEGDENYLYATARLAYLDVVQRLGEARANFKKILEKTTSERHRFKALLGIANTLYTEGDYKNLPSFIAELQKFEPLDRDDDKISLTIFLANYHLSSGDSPQLARDYFKKALALASAQTWTYFIGRCLFGLASYQKQEGQHAEMMWTLEMLQSFIADSEQALWIHIVNEHFGAHLSINTPMEFDTVNRRILLKNRWLPFHDRPLLFEFLILLRDRETFVEKSAIAQHLWPNEDYKPRVHDPRIFDIAKRARAMIEDYENQPVVLLSGRMGYKLASI